jgi:N-acetyltransferase
MNLLPVTLAGRHVRLEPLALDHARALAEVGLAPDLWRWIPTPVTSLDKMRHYVEAALDDQRRGTALPFAILDAGTGTVIGSTRFGAIDARNRRVEIGWTWLALSHQRSASNTEAKRLLLGHAFEAQDALRVELKTDALNEKSRRAIRRIGAVEEGIFRKHSITASGRVRDVVYHSIIDTEWPQVRARLDERLADAAPLQPSTRTET